MFPTSNIFENSSGYLHSSLNQYYFYKGDFIIIIVLFLN